MTRASKANWTWISVAALCAVLSGCGSDVRDTGAGTPASASVIISRLRGRLRTLLAEMSGLEEPQPPSERQRTSYARHLRAVADDVRGASGTA
jgi:hypothetical protein